jgi:hypothetical protein
MRTQSAKIMCFLMKDRNPRRAAAHVDAGGAQFLFILDQRRDARDIGRRGKARDIQIAALDAMDQVLHHRGIDRQKMHVAGQPVADLAARIAKARAVIQRKVHGLGVQHLAPRADVGHVAGGQRARHVLFGHDRILQADLARQPIAARLGPGENRR